MKNKIKKAFIFILLVLAIGSTVYMLGPKPNPPKLTQTGFAITHDLAALDMEITNGESAIPGIRKGCEAKIVWADVTKKTKTKVAFLYIHGFGASQMEADPVHRNLAEKYSANLYLARLPGHGVDLGDSTMATVTADDFANSVEYALAVTKILGEEIIIISNSFGGALSCYLASKHPEIEALVLYSPCIKTCDENIEIFVKPWGLQLVNLFSGSCAFNYKPYNSYYAKYWTTHYNFNGLSAFQNFLKYTMNNETFKKIKCPVFMGYWYKNENVKDTIASVPAMLNMFNQLGSVNKQKVSFKNVGNHEISTPILSKDVETVQRETEMFLDKIILQR